MSNNHELIYLHFVSREFQAHINSTHLQRMAFLKYFLMNFHFVKTMGVPSASRYKAVLSYAHILVGSLDNLIHAAAVLMSFEQVPQILLT